MMKILTIVGARPQFIKAAAVSRELRTVGGLTEVLVHTGQHFDANMSEVFFRQLGISEPKYNLGVHGLGHGAMTGRMMEAIEGVILSEQPRYVVVYGDTNSTLAGALAARKLLVDVVHVEAGLRSFNLAMPEEVNRVLTDRISSVLYCPTDAAVRNLHDEGFGRMKCRIVRSGDVMEDSARYFRARALEDGRMLERLGIPQEPFILCTFHRAENTDNRERLAEIVAGLNQLAATHPVVLPLHPRTKAALTRHGLTLHALVLDPVGYLEMVALLSRSALVVTDSGGLQKEAYFFDRHCVILRDETEWVELVEHGFSVLVGADRHRIVQEAERRLGMPFTRSLELYGAGTAARLIADDLVHLG